MGIDAPGFITVFFEVLTYDVTLQHNPDANHFGRY